MVEGISGDRLGEDVLEKDIKGYPQKRRLLQAVNSVKWNNTLVRNETIVGRDSDCNVVHKSYTNYHS